MCEGASQDVPGPSCLCSNGGSRQPRNTEIASQKIDSFQSVCVTLHPELSVNSLILFANSVNGSYGNCSLSNKCHTNSYSTVCRLKWHAEACYACDLNASHQSLSFLHLVALCFCIFIFSWKREWFVTSSKIIDSC